MSAGNLTLTGGITLSSTSTLDAVRSGGLIDITTTVISGSGDLNVASSDSSGGVVRFSVANTYSGTTTINSGATLQLENVNALQNTTLDTGTSGSQQVSFTVAGANTYNIGAILGGDTLDFGANTISVGANNATTSFTGTLAGSGGSLTKAGTGTLTLSGNSTYTGTTTLNTGTLVIGNTAAAGTGTITQTDGSSVLKLDTTGTIANAMSIYNVATNQTVTLSGAITAQNTTYDVASGTTLSLNGTISGSGGITKNGTGTLEVNGASNTYTGDTVVNAGTLEANASGALGATGNITVHNGGSILVQASNAIGNSSNVNLNGGTWSFNGDISDTVGALTLSANSTIDMDNGNISLIFSSLASALTSSTRLNVYNYTLYSDHIYFTSNANLSSSLQYISFYSDFGSSFIGNSFIEGLSSPWQVRPVPEPETWATAALLLIGGGIWMWRRRKEVV